MTGTVTKVQTSNLNGAKPLTSAPLHPPTVGSGFPMDGERLLPLAAIIWAFPQEYDSLFDLGLIQTTSVSSLLV